MGNISTARRNKQKLNTYLTPRQKLAVKASLEFLKDELPNLGAIVFIRFFQTQPKFKQLFPKIVTVNENNELELQLNEESLNKHAHNVMHSLGAAIENMEEPENINMLLRSIGHIHVKQNVKQKMLYRLWPAVDYGLKEFLRGRYTKDVSIAWKKVFLYSCRQIEFGMIKALQELQTEYN